nr:hypothetical protein [Gammaproteobacteria bacterium]
MPISNSDNEFLGYSAKPIHGGQFVYVIKGWATFEYEGVGVRTLRAGDCMNQRPMIAHREIEYSDDYEVLEIVAPADFKTRIVDAPVDAAAD